MKKRELSPFMVEEMLFDYATRELDSSRETDVRNEVEKSKTFQEELAKIQLGLSYFEGLSRIGLSLSLIEEVRGQKTYWQYIKSNLNFHQWPPLLRWTVEAFGVVLTFALLTIFVPWGQIRDFVLQESQTELIITEVQKSKTRTQLSQVQVGSDSTSFEDEGTSQVEVAVTDKTPTAAEVAQSVVPPMTPPIANTNLAKTPTKPIASTQVSTKVTEVKKQGFVFRGSVKIVNSEMGSVKIKQKIVELGGRKAGEVELGWKRNQGDYYFHFTIPESKLNEVQEYIKSLGDLQLSRDPHPRLMPDGIVRIILTAEESQN